MSTATDVFVGMPRSSIGKILVVDNDNDVIAQTKKILGQVFTPAKVDTASNKAEALELAERDRVDLYVLDIRLERDEDEYDFSGVELAEQLELLAPHVPKIIRSLDPAARKKFRERFGRGAYIPSSWYFVSKSNDVELIAKLAMALLSRAGKYGFMTPSVSRTSGVQGFVHPYVDRIRYRLQPRPIAIATEVMFLIEDLTVLGIPSVVPIVRMRRDAVPLLGVFAVLLALGFSGVALAVRDYTWLLGTFVLFALAAFFLRDGVLLWQIATDDPDRPRGAGQLLPLYTVVLLLIGMIPIVLGVVQGNLSAILWSLLIYLVAGFIIGYAEPLNSNLITRLKQVDSHNYSGAKEWPARWRKLMPYMSLLAVIVALLGSVLVIISGDVNYFIVTITFVSLALVFLGSTLKLNS